MRIPFILIFVLLIPAMIALGHDIYLFFINHMPNGGLPSWELIKEKFKFSAFGFLWTNYEPESYKTVASGLAPETWAKIDSFLTIKAFFGCLSFAGIITALMAFAALFGLGPMASEGGRVYGGGNKKAPTIKRKSSADNY